MRRLSVRHRKVLAAGLLACAVTVSGCDDSDADNGGGTQGGDSSPAQLSAAELAELTPGVVSTSVLVDGEVMVFGKFTPATDTWALDADVAFTINRQVPYSNIDEYEDAGVELETTRTFRVPPGHVSGFVWTHTPKSLTESGMHQREYVFSSEDEVTGVSNEEMVEPQQAQPVEDTDPEPAGPVQETHARYIASFDLPYAASGTVLCYDARDDLLGGGEVDGVVSGTVEVDVVTAPPGATPFSMDGPSSCRFHPTEIEAD